MRLKNLKIFITGGAGFIGSNLVDRLIKNNKITVYDNLTSGEKSYLKEYLERKNFKLIVGDLLDFKKLKKSIKNHDFVFHLASNPDIAKSLKDPNLDLRQGIISAFNVLEAMRLTGVRKIVFTSGSGVYGDQGTKYTAEDFGPLLPVSMYGASKLAAEAVISAFCHLYDMQSWIFRPANIVGRNQTHGVCYDFIKKLRKNPKELDILGDGTQSKSYLYIDDFINALILAIEKSNDVVNLFNVSLNSFTNVKTIAKTVAEEMGLKKVSFKYTGGSKGWKGDVPKVRMDTKKINKLGWKPKFNSDQAIRKSTRNLLCRLQ